MFRKHNPRLWDTFIFGDELDILECRLVEYTDTNIYRHVIVEATADHQGHPKPLYFQENKDRFAPFLDRIIYVPVKLKSKTNWDRIAEQRNAITKGLKDSHREDVILFSDADEILSPEGVKIAFENAPLVDKGVRFSQRHAVLCVDWEEANFPWHGPRAILQKKTPKKISEIRDESPHLLTEGGGWHLSWLGGPEVIEKKTTQYCHPELDEYILSNYESMIRDGFYWGPDAKYTKGTSLTPVTVDENWPKWIREGYCPDSWFRDFYADKNDEDSRRGLRPKRYHHAEYE
jgi:beta-1,4-mannosyl-glycoprotein beta-1,4-N-acetylglucosaminyltransferase